MAKILLDYVFPITVIEPTPAASTAFLKQAVVVAKPRAGQEGNIGQVFECTNMTQVAVRTDNENAAQLFNAGMNRVYVLLSNDLDLADALVPVKGEAWTVLISDDFDDGDLTEVDIPPVAASVKIQDITFTAKTPGLVGNDITIEYVDTNTDGEASSSATGGAITVSIEAGVTTATAVLAAIQADVASNALVSGVIDVGDEADQQQVESATNLAGGLDGTTAAGELDVGTFDGVVAFSSDDAETCQVFATGDKRCGFFRNDLNGAKNMFFAFGKLLSNQAGWRNQQYISMPFNDGIDELGQAEALFADRVSFVLNDTEFGNRLAFFVAGGKAIAAPYIKKNLCIDLQSRALQWISANQPDYTLVNASLLESALQDDVIQKKYIDTRWISNATIEISLVNDNFVASGSINMVEPKALWKITGELMSTLQE